VADKKPYPGAVENRDYYVVKDGDTLREIAKRFLGGRDLYPLLKEINLLDGNEIEPGMVLLLHPEGLEPTSPLHTKWWNK